LPRASRTRKARKAWPPSSRNVRRRERNSFPQQHPGLALDRFLIVRNPAAGRGRALRRWDGIARRLREAGLSYDEAVTRRPLEAVEIVARKASSYACVVAAGGDGTVHEVVNGLMRAGGQTALGVIPLGSGDDFAKLLSSRDPIQRLLVQEPRHFDIGRIVAGDTRYFANGMDIGFGAHGARNMASVPRFLTGFGAYLGALVLTLLRYPSLRVRVQLDDAPPIDLTTAMTAVMNGSTFGGRFRVCPEARADDGLLDMLIVDALGRLAILGLVPKILRGAHSEDPRVRLLRARRVTIESDTPLLVEADGEIAFHDARRLEIEVLPAVLRVVS
jgi:YegS/Rv2252/BmrU family lipid kinase